MIERGHLLLIPGLLCDRTVWAHQSAQLAARVSVEVPVPGLEDTLGAMAEGILRSAPERFALAGHSMGGRIALEMVRRAPGRAAGLALLDTGYQPLPAGEAGRRETAGRQALLEQARREGMRAMGRTWVQGMVHPQRLDDGALIDRILDMIEAKPLALFEAQIRALLNRPDASALLPRIGCPTLVLCGREDGWSPLARHREMAARIPESTLVGVADCGHMSTMERPEAVTTALAAWLERLAQ